MLHDAAYVAWCACAQAKDDGKAGGGGMFKGLIDTIIGNLQLSIGNVHIRYEVGQHIW